MSEVTPIRIRYKPTRAYDVFQQNYPGAQITSGKRGWWSGSLPAADAAITKLASLGRYVFCVGSFTTLGGSARAGFAAVCIDDGTVSSRFNPVVTGGTIQGVAAAGNYVYILGDFTNIDGNATLASRAVKGIARYSYSGVLDTTWNPLLNTNPDLDFAEYNPVDGTLFIAGGGLTTVNGTARVYCAEVTLDDAGTLTAFDPQPNGRVRVMRYATGQTYPIYIGGDFTTVGGAAQVRMTRTDSVGARDTTYAPAPDGSVYDILIDDIQSYIAGSFTNAGGSARNYLALIGPSGTAAAWNPDASADAYSLAEFRGVIFAGGAFTTIGGNAYNHLMAWDTGSGAIRTDWNPNCNGTVYKILLIDRTLYSCGSFTTIATGGGGTYLANDNWPLFSDANTKYVAKTGSDGAAGTEAAPYLTITYAVSTIDATFRYIVVTDSEEYNEQITGTFPAGADGGIYAADGKAPIIKVTRGAKAGTYGARVSGRTVFSAGGAATFLYVSKKGSDATGTRGNVNLPYLTIMAAHDAASDGDTIQIQDSGSYSGQIAGTKSLTIQAANGKVPSLIHTGATLLTWTAAKTLTIYGITFSCPVSTTYTTIVAPTTITLQDCTFKQYKIALSQVNAAHTTTVNSCSFFDTYYEALSFTAAGTFAVTNNYFKRCGSSSQHGDVYVSHTTSSYSETYCTHEDSRALYGVYISGGASGTQTVTITSNVFKATTIVPSNAGGVFAGATAGSGVANKSATISNCLFDGLGGPAIHVSYWKGNGSYTKCVIKNCMKNSGAGLTYSAWFYAAYSGTFYPSVLINAFSGQTNAVSDFVFIGTQSYARTDNLTSLLAFLAYPGITTTITVSRCAFINAPQNSIWVIGGSLTWTFPGAGSNTLTLNLAIAGMIEKGQTTTYSVAYYIPFLANYYTQSTPAGTGSISYSVNATGLQPSPATHLTTKAAYYNADPNLVSSEAFNENSALMAQSVGTLLNVANNPVCDSGVFNPTVSLTVTDVRMTINGFIFTGDANFCDGVSMSSVGAGQGFLENCSLYGLGNTAISTSASTSGGGATNGANVINCLGYNLNGKFIECADNTPVIKNCVGYAASSAWLWNSATYLDAENNTGYSCQSGFYEGGISLFKNNVFFGSSYDYTGGGILLDSDVCRVNGSPTYTGTVRLNPLFRATGLTPDLRLQATAVGNAYDSPAVGIADDGNDAGAYGMFYGASTTTWTTIDFATKGWRAPDAWLRSEEPVFLTETDKFNGDVVSAAAAFRKSHSFTWDANNDMPTAEVTALIDLYTTEPGECQISWDGGTTWIPCRVLKSESFSWREVGDLPYAATGVPTPVATMKFRESA